MTMSHSICADTREYGFPENEVRKPIHVAENMEATAPAGSKEEAESLSCECRSASGANATEYSAAVVNKIKNKPVPETPTPIKRIEMATSTDAEIRREMVGFPIFIHAFLVSRCRVFQLNIIKG